MTCIAAVIGSNDTIYMGGDSAGVAEDSTYLLEIGKEAKVWKNGGILWGACGSFRVAQILRWHLTIPIQEDDQDVLEYITGPLVDAMRTSLENGGALTIWLEDFTESMGGGLLLGYNGRVFQVQGDFGVGELIHDYGAVGCGGQIACGSLATTEGLDISPKKRVRLALSAAERHSHGVRGPMVIIKS